MKDLKALGLKKRTMPEFNYNAIWSNGETFRVGFGHASELPPNDAEFYDVGINTKCNAECDFCYVSASHNGINFPNISDTWKRWMATKHSTIKYGVTHTNKPFQIAIGSTGEPTIHPEFCEFLKAVYETGVLPNYTTNGIVLSQADSPVKEKREWAQKVLQYTQDYCGGVAVSCNKHLEPMWKSAVEYLLNIDINICLHHIISDNASVDRFLKLYNEYKKGDIRYHVLLPLMPSGRSKQGVSDKTWDYLEQKLSGMELLDVAFGAHFVPYLLTSDKINASLYPPESLSKNVILTPEIKITRSSFNLEPIMTVF